jgi:hypothetical protein
MSNTKLTVSWLGPGSVGKTTLITVIYKLLREAMAATELSLSTDPESEAILNKHYQELTQLVTSFDATNKGIQGTEQPRNFNFILDRKKWIGKRPSLELEFIDVPGNWVSQTASSSEYNSYLKKISESGAIVITIDTLALMMGGGRFHEQVNQTETVTKMIETAYQDLSEPRLVVFAPVKCETFLQPGKDPKLLEDAIKKGYYDLINNVLIPNRNIAAVITPVKTVGCVVCGGWEDHNGRFQRWYLNKTGINHNMNTEYADQPLRYLLLFLMKQFMEEQQGLWRTVNNFLHTNDDLKEVMRRFAQGCRKVPPFETLIGHEFLRV